MKHLTLTAVSLLLIGLTMSGTAYSQVPAWEREALIAIYNAFDGGPGSSWLGDAGTECDWSGVQCNSGLVIGLILSNKNFSGYIPAEIGNLTSLSTLQLQGNKLSGVIPTQFGNLTDLTAVDLRNNQLTGTIPAALGNLTKLTALRLNSNQLTGSIPAELGNLTNLTELWLYSNQLTGSIPAELGDLSSLNKLDLSYNQLSGSIPAELGNLSNLFHLKLYDNQLSGSIPAELGDLPKLTLLQLDNNQLSGAIPPALAEISYPIEVAGNPKLDRNILIKLYSSTYAINWTNKTGWAGVGGTECDWYGVTCLGGDVTGLNLGLNNLVGSIPSELGNFTTITSLDLSSNTLTGSIPTELGNLTTLTSLDLSSNTLTGSIPAELANLTALTALDLSTNSLAGPLPQWLSDMAISSLDITGAFTFTSNSPPIVTVSGGSRAVADTDGIAGESVSFTGTATDSDGTIATTQWLVGGSIVATGLSATISLPNRSTVVTFKATDNDGVSSTTTATITITAPSYIVTDEWPSPYNGVTPDSSLGLAFNNIGIYDAAGSTIYTCLRIFTDGLPGSASGISEFDIGLTIVSLDEGTVQITKFREFNVIGALNENVELPDCSGKFETTTAVFTDTIETKSYFNFLGNLLPIVKTFETTFDLIDGDNLILKLSSYQELTAD